MLDRRRGMDREGVSPSFGFLGGSSGLTSDASSAGASAFSVAFSGFCCSSVGGGSWDDVIVDGWVESCGKGDIFHKLWLGYKKIV